MLVQVAREILSGARGRDLAQTQHVDVARHVHDTPHVVIDQEDRHVLGGKQVDPLIHLFGDFRREPDARLIDQAESRPHQIGLGELEHLLLSAG